MRDRGTIMRAHQALLAALLGIIAASAAHAVTLSDTADCEIGGVPGDGTLDFDLANQVAGNTCRISNPGGVNISGTINYGAGSAAVDTPGIADEAQPAAPARPARHSRSGRGPLPPAITLSIVRPDCLRRCPGLRVPLFRRTRHAIPRQEARPAHPYDGALPASTLPRPCLGMRTSLAGMTPPAKPGLHSPALKMARPASVRPPEGA